MHETDWSPSQLHQDCLSWLTTLVGVLVLGRVRVHELVRVFAEQGHDLVPHLHGGSPLLILGLLVPATPAV
jgi:hypothetical protein